MQWVPVAPSPDLKRQGREADRSPASSVTVNNCGAIPPLFDFFIISMEYILILSQLKIKLLTVDSKTAYKLKTVDT
jgi:hypothetical protein